ncbi:hypothetical protein L7F22_052264 [Adiantum nelumboides]|nr:hypothetical protein [Adiantum nelumboides]
MCTNFISQYNLKYLQSEGCKGGAWGQQQGRALVRVARMEEGLGGTAPVCLMKAIGRPTLLMYGIERQRRGTAQLNSSARAKISQRYAVLLPIFYFLYAPTAGCRGFCEGCGVVADVPIDVLSGGSSVSNCRRGRWSSNACTLLLAFSTARPSK